MVLFVLFGTITSAKAEPDIRQGILGTWTMKPLKAGQSGDVNCRYEQSIIVEKQVAPNRFTGSYRSRHVCGPHVSRGAGALIITLRGRSVVIKGVVAGWTVETLRYISSKRMAGKDTRGYPAVYTRPISKPLS